MTYDELRQWADMPLLPLIEKAHAIHKQHWPEGRIQICSLLSIKTGGCSENCAYCAQSAHYSTGIQREKLLPKEKVLERAMQAREAGATRFCMGAAWKGIKASSPHFPEILELVQAVSALGLEVCATLGKIGTEEARALRQAGLSAYNHNLDTSPEHYPDIVYTHTYQDRLDTIKAVQEAGIAVCCGGIVGIGEAPRDRLRLLEIISSFDPAPESVPINALIPIGGTPLQGEKPVTNFEIIRMIALTRIALPTSHVRLSAGRGRMNEEAQTLCFYAGANSIFYVDRLLTARNSSMERDRQLLDKLGLKAELPDASLLAPVPAGAELYPADEPHACTHPGACEEQSPA